MAKQAFEKIAAGLEDAIAFVQGDMSRGRVTLQLDEIDVAAIRKRTGKTQAQFARAFGLPIGTVRDWEQNRRRPDGPARILLLLIGIEPDIIEDLIQRAGGQPWTAPVRNHCCRPSLCKDAETQTPARLATDPPAVASCHPDGRHHGRVTGE